MRQRHLPLTVPRARRLPRAAAAAEAAPAAAPPPVAKAYLRRSRSVAKPPAVPAPAQVGAAAPVDTAVQPVVVATADPSLTRMLTFALDQARLPHVTFQSGTTVLRELLAMPERAHPTVVVLDVDLPGVDGHAILERLGVERPNTFLIVVLSSHADEAVQVRSVLAGALDHLAKPFNVRVLMAKLLRWTAIAARSQAAG